LFLEFINPAKIFPTANMEYCKTKADEIHNTNNKPSTHGEISTVGDQKWVLYATMMLHGYAICG
jgi:hypothetical protein